MQKIYEIDDLLIRRSGLQVLEIDALDIFEGEILAVIGPNGAGKSTLLLTLSRLLKPDRGQVSFKGQSIQSMDDLFYRRKLALVLQEPLLLNRSVFDNVAVGLKFRGHNREEVNQRVDYWLERFGVIQLKDRQAQQLSGGEAQRVSLGAGFRPPARGAFTRRAIWLIRCPHPGSAPGRSAQDAERGGSHHHLHHP